MKRLSLMLAALGHAAIGAMESWDGLIPSLQVPDAAWRLPGAWSWSPGFYAPKHNQRKARKAARRVNKVVQR